MPPQVNATITRITTATAATGGRDDWDEAGGVTVDDEPAGAGIDKWLGEADAYYREKVDRRAGPAGVDVITVRTLWVDTADVPDELDTDDVITFTHDGATRTARAQAIARARLDGIPVELATTRIDLELV